MRILVPSADITTDTGILTRPAPETRAALTADGRDPEYVRVGPGTDSAYFELLRAVWAKGESFIVVEHDLVPYPGAIAELEECDQPWCGKPYSLSTGVAGSCLGCTRFSAELLRAEPDAIEKTVILRQDVTARFHWSRLDSRLREVLEERGYFFHSHWPAIDHLNPNQVFHGAVNCVQCGAPFSTETMMTMPPPYSHECSEEQWIPQPPIVERQPNDGTNTILVSNA